MQNPTWFQIAQKEIGVHEYTDGENPRILEYDDATSLHAKQDEVPWCSAFANWCMRQAGIKGTGLANARSWLDWGDKLQEPVEGCVVVLRRGAPPSGHVAFYAGSPTPGVIKLLGGNQGDQVKYSYFKTADVLGYRWPHAAAIPVPDGNR